MLLFYPFAYTFICPTEIVAFSEKKAEFDALNAQGMFTLQRKVLGGVCVGTDNQTFRQRQDANIVAKLRSQRDRGTRTDISITLIHPLDKTPHGQRLGVDLVLAVSTDSQHTLLAWSRAPRAEGGLKGAAGSVGLIPLVSDFGKTVSRSYGVLVEDEHDEMFGAALRGLFVIDPNGKIRSVTINDDQVHVARVVCAPAS